MKKPIIYPKCEQRRHDCFSCDETGHCHCLNNTTFRRRNGKTYKCPFYKTKAEVGEDLINIDDNGENEYDARKLGLPNINKVS